MTVKLVFQIIFLFFGILPLIGINAQQENQNLTLFSKHLNEKRVVQINLPKSYESTNNTYPVLFVLDGEYVFEYAKGSVTFLGNDFGFLPEMIVVGVPNTDRNRDLFVSLEPNGDYLNFIDFLSEELVPYINKNYRANSFKVLYGWSSGAGLANCVFVKNPGLFSGYILSGAGIGPKTAAFIKNHLSPDKYKGIHLFASSEGTTFRSSGLQKHKALIEQISPSGLHKNFKIYDQLSHVDVLSQGLYDGLKFVFRDFYIPDSTVSKGIEAIISYYQNLKKTYLFKVNIPIGAINEISAALIQKKNIDKALQLVEYGLGIYPNNTTLLGTMGDICQHQNHSKLAASYYQQAFQQAKDSINVNKYRVLYTNVTQPIDEN